MQSNEPNEELLERINLKPSHACETCGGEECICAEQQNAAATSADIQSKDQSQLSTGDNACERNLDPLQVHVQSANENPASHEAACTQENSGSKIANQQRAERSDSLIQHLVDQASGHQFQNLLSICMLEFLDDRTLWGACIAFGSIMFAAANSIAHKDYVQIYRLFDPPFITIMGFLVVRQIVCWFNRRSRSQSPRKGAVETIGAAARYLSNFVMVTLLSASICLEMILGSLPAENHFVWTIGDSPCAPPLLFLTAVSIVVVLLQELWMFLRPDGGDNVWRKASLMTRAKAHAKMFSGIMDVSFTTLLIIISAGMLMFWSDCIWFISATVVAQSVRENDPATAITWTQSMESYRDPWHARETSYLTALAYVAAGREQDAEAKLKAALSNPQFAPPRPQLKTAILNAQAELDQRQRIKQKLSSSLQNDKSDQSYNLKYGPFVLNLQMRQAPPKQTEKGVNKSGQ